MSAPGTRNPFGHIDLRVPSIAQALPFYEALLPALGFTRRYDGGDWRVFATELPPPAAAYFGITESAQFTPNENRIAFWAADRAEVALREVDGTCRIEDEDEAERDQRIGSAERQRIDEQLQCERQRTPLRLS